jgi:cytochrome c-type biogenesis protein CcsB
VLATVSISFMYVTLALYAAAFVFFALDLAKRSTRATVGTAVPSAVSRRAGTAEDVVFVEAGALSERRSERAEGSTGATSASIGASADSAVGGRMATLTAPAQAAGKDGADRPGSGRRGPVARWTARVESEADDAHKATLSGRVAMFLTIVGFVFHLFADVARGVDAGRVPWANMWEFSMTGTLVIIGIYLLANLRWDLRYLGTFITFLVVILLGVAITRYYVPVVPLPPALQSYWLVIHILVAILATAFFAIGFALSGAQLLQVRREHQIAAEKPTQLRFLGTFPKSDSLENLAYRLNIVGFIFWTFTLIAGAIWAEKAWGRYWGWDTKEVWTFIIWVIYAGYIHARATRGWRGTRSAWLALIGFSAVMFNFAVVNVFFHGLHSYSGLTS